MTVEAKSFPRQRWFSHENARDPLNRASVVPLYYQLVTTLEDRILNGTWAPNEPLPSERDLCVEFGVSRAVVRPALEILEREGRLLRVQGQGTFIAPPKTTLAIGGIVRIFASAIPPNTEMKIIEAARRPPEGEIANMLHLSPGGEILHITATMSIDGRPVCLCYSMVSATDIPWLSALLREDAVIRGVGPFGSIDLAPSDVKLEAAYCTPFEAEHLSLSAGDTIFMIHSIEYEASKHDGDTASPIEAAWIVYPAEVVRFALRVE